ncbi:MAG: hypothetical protein ACLSVD_17140 [Eggerthellaceae bacterium]
MAAWTPSTSCAAPSSSWFAPDTAEDAPSFTCEAPDATFEERLKRGHVGVHLVGAAADATDAGDELGAAWASWLAPAERSWRSEDFDTRESRICTRPPLTACAPARSVGALSAIF